MSLFDGLCCVAYVLFLLGEAQNFWGSVPAKSLWVMVLAVTTDFFITVVPNPGCKSLAINIGSSPEIITAIVLCVVVWLTFLGAVFVRLMGRMTLFFVLLVATKLLWFVDLVLFFYGVYNFRA